ncbi:MAG: hypothetical protein EOP49_27180, partial [Sphingobacteriales bacterium]
VVTVSPTATTSYTVTSTNSFGCTANSSLTVSVEDAPSATISGTATVCQNTAAPTITFTGIGSSAPYTFTYQINGGASQTISTVSGNSVTVNAPTNSVGSFTYNLVSVSADGCSQVLTVSATITVVTAITASANSQICAGSSLFLSASGGSTYTWSGPNGFSSTQQYPVLNTTTAAMSGTYTVTDVSFSGCSNVGTVTVAINDYPSAIALVTSPMCLGSDITLSASGGTTYSWTGPNNFNSNQQNPVITNAKPASAGNYTATVTSNGCSSTAVATVSLNAIPLPVANSNSPVCSGDTLQLLASAATGATYTWSGPDGFTSNQQNPSVVNITAAATGNYTLTATVNGCSAISTILAEFITPVTASATAPLICGGTSTTLSAALTSGESNALRLDGGGQHASFPTFTFNSNGGAVTVEFWSKVNSSDAGNSTLFELPVPSGKRFLAHVPFGDNTLYWDYGNISTSGRVSVNYGPYLNKWTHVALVSSGTNNSFKAIYLNGVLVASGTDSDGTNTVGVTGLNLGIGNHKGGIDEFRIWDHVRSQAEIESGMYNSLDVNPAGLKAYWKFDEGSGTAISDISPNGFNGTLVQGNGNGLPTWTTRDKVSN